MLHSRTILLLPVLALLAGCPIFGHEPVERGVQVSCEGDFDCPQDTFCDADTHECVGYDFEVCLTDGDCPVGSYCDRADGGCYIPVIAECGGDGDCGPDFECDFRGSCRPQTFGSCLVDGDCSTGQVCIENTCTPIGEVCQFDFQCAAGFACVNNRCRLLCGPDTRCPTGTSCQQSLCLPDVGECVDSSECPDLTTHCVEGVCLRRCDAGCDDAIEVCDDQGFCRPRTRPDPGAPTPFCQSDADCSGTLCVDGVCRTECDSTAPAPDDICASFDGQLPICGADDLCYAPSELASDCGTQLDCSPGRDCIDGTCR